ncbi:MAG: threonine synthase [Acidobacteria bacterium]|nr:MAG: threonine synthase [Acidobacteriota bacterium]
MRFVSTKGNSQKVSLEEALFAGPAPDGGLYIPETLPVLSAETLDALSGGSIADTALTVAKCLFDDDLDSTTLESIVRGSLDFTIPLVEVEDELFSLELFHGPTHAFKDVGARFMARLMGHYLKSRDERATVLVATSGDTGSAVAHAFYGLDGIRVIVLFPKGRVSALQQRLFTTLGDNVFALSVDGTFDDCQRLVKSAFADPELADQTLVSANSINVGRLLPQTFYYFHLFAELPRASRDSLVVATPSGNFGNLTAGLMAKRMGLPITRFVAATNVNDVVPEYLASGDFRPRPSTATLSNAMDVGDPSNFARILWLYDGELDAIRADVAGRAYTDENTRATILDVYERRGYVLDPHSAIGYLGARDHRQKTAVFLATAHAAKFQETVEAVLKTPVPLPPAIAACAERPETITEIDASIESLKGFLKP